MLFYFVGFYCMIYASATKYPNRRIGKYDQLVLVQKSPIASFNELRHQWPTKTLIPTYDLSEQAKQVLFTPNRWILRGFWPQKRSGRSPSTCQRISIGYISTLINSTLRDRLQIRWPQLLKDKFNGSYWEYEWSLHGSCVTDISNLANPEMYFNKSLEFLEKYNIGTMLEKYHIYPGESYAVDNIYELIKYEYNIEPRLTCLLNQNSEQQIEQYILDVNLCFNKSLELENCINLGYRFCNLSMPIIYPTIQE